MNDKVRQNTPHCHAPIHPAAPTPTPVAHPALPLSIISACAPTVMIDGQQAAIVGSVTEICRLPSCVPNGPGVVSMGSATVFHCNLPAARVYDTTAHAGCIAPIPCPTGVIMPPCSPTVIIGG